VSKKRVLGIPIGISRNSLGGCVARVRWLKFSMESETLDVDKGGTLTIADELVFN
jgi:hypothetical protein